MATAMAAVPPVLAQESDQPAAAQETQQPKADQPAQAQQGETPKPTPTPTPTPKAQITPEGEAPPRFAEEVVVKGFRTSLEQSVQLKKDAINVRDSIVTEDIGKMPDLNLAEAIQRVPGVAIVRSGGEGRQMSLRGLGADFTHVTLNGMEVPSSVGGLDSFGGINRGRAFDFNVFSAELFNRIDVDKTATSPIEEGGIAGTVQMYTMRPLSNPGFHATFSAQGGYNDVSNKYDPRFTGTLSTTNEAKTLGFVVSAAYTGRTPFQDGFGTVRFAVPDRPFKGNNTGLSNAELNSIWYPRLPRQDSFRHNDDRFGISTGVQFRPSDKFQAAVNWVHSDFKSTTDSYNSFAEFRRSAPYGYNVITVNDVTVLPQGTGEYAVAGDFSGVGLRTESRQNVDDTKFDQITGDFSYDFSERLTMTGMVGYAQSNFTDNYFRANLETLHGADFSYDFTENPNVAIINYNIDVTDPANYTLQDNELFQLNTVDRKNYTGRLDFDWGISASRKHILKFGGIYNDRDVNSGQAIQNGIPPSNFAPITKVFTYVDAGNFGNATELNFLVLDYDKAKAAYNYGTFTPDRGPGRATWDVHEKTAGVYAAYNLNTYISSHGFRADLGARFVNTKTDATGWLSQTIPNTESNSYNNLLPAVNLAFNTSQNFLLRAAASRTMTRPGLDSLAPTKTYTDVNFTVSGGNALLKPLLADSVDLAAEWYFAPHSVAAVTMFYKNIKSFISSPRTSEPLRPEDYAGVRAVYPTQPALLDPTLIWTYSTSANVDGTHLKGFEVAYQQPFTFLPGALSNLGFVGNYSFVDSETTTVRNGVTVKVPLEGLSKNSFNATLYYEAKSFGVRFSLNYRDDYITTNTGSNGNVSEATTGPTRLDMSAYYHFNPTFSLILEGVNLTNSYERLYTTGDGTMNLVREYNTTGRQFYGGIRMNF
jgi:iron complex outermembrane recepter protein